jgi:NNP family nitrate/nitrite transporter-like MFS transporter
VPFVNTKNVGLVSGIVGAGGNVGGMLFGFLFKSETITYVEAFTYIGYIVIAISFVILVTRFQKQPAGGAQLNSNMAGSAA